MTNTVLLLVIMIGMGLPVAASNPPGSYPFTPNHGQLADPEGRPLNNVLFTAQAPGVSIFFKREGFSYVFSEVTGESGTPGEESTLVLKSHRVDFDFLDAETSAIVPVGSPSPDYSNFYFAHCSEGIKNVHSFQELHYQSVYPGIDLHFYSSPQGMKYDFVVAPGADVSRIRMKITGADALSLPDAATLRFSTSLGEFTEHIPEAYHTEQYGSGTKAATACGYRLEDNILSFDIPESDPDRTLVIDPLSTWATFFGGNNYDYGYGVAYSSSAVYMAGNTASPDYPFTAGAHQTVLGGSRDAHLVKFDYAGNRLWATYYGGTGGDYGEDVAVEQSTEMIYITGYCGSGFPTTAGAYQTTFGGVMDAFLVKFDNTGARQWATYVGGEDEDRSEGVAVDPTGNVFVAGRTVSNFQISTAGVFQAARSGGFDSFVMKFTSAGAQSWGSYFGGTGTEYGHAVATDGSGNVIVTGETYSSNFPAGASAGNTAHQITRGGAFGDIDFFVYKLNPAGATRLWATYYGGVNVERGFGVTTDASDNVIACGTAFGSFPVTAGVVQTVFGGGTGVGDGAVIKFSPTGTRLWATYLGGTNYDFAMSVDATTANTLVVGGETQSAWVSVNNCAIICGGSSDFCGFIVHLNSAGSTRLMSTIIGGTNNFNSVLDVAVDDFDNIYATGFTNSTDFPTGGPVVFQNTYGGGLSDAYLGLINDDSCDAVILAMDLILLQAEWNAKGIRLDWQPNFSVGAGRWIAGISRDGSAFEEIEIQPQREGNAYRWQDIRPLSFSGGEVFCRIRFEEISGGSIFSEIATVTVPQSGSGLRIYPVPSADNIHITSGYSALPSWVKIFNQTGTLIAHYSVPSDSVDVSELADGIYFLQAEYEGIRENGIFIIRR